VRGRTSENVTTLRRTPQDQIGPRLRAWIYAVLGDFSLDSYAPFLRKQGLGENV